MLTKIRLENFKSWRELDLDLSNLTILFGTNSSGKSSVLQSLLLLKQTETGFSRASPINLGGSDNDYVDLGSFRDLVFKHDEKKQVGIRLEWLSEILEMPWMAGEQEFEIKTEKIAYAAYFRKLKDRVVVEQLDHEILSPKPVSFHVKRVTGEAREGRAKKIELSSELLGLDGSDKFRATVETTLLLPSKYRSKFGIELVMFIRWLLSLLMGRVTYLGPLRSFPQRVYSWRGTTWREIGPRGERVIDVMLASERNNPDLVRQVSAWLAQMELVSDFEIQPIDEDKRFYEVRAKAGPSQSESSLVDVGFGVSQVLPVVTLLFFAPEGSIVLLEQPELHLHPCAQAHLADLFLHVAETRNLQLIVESHSEHLLRRLQRRIAEGKEKLATPEHIKMYFCQIEHGESTIQPVKVDEYGQIANWPTDFFGDISGDLDAMTDAALERRRQELAKNGRLRD